MCLCQSSWMSSSQILLKVLTEMSGKVTIAFNNKEPPLKLKNTTTWLFCTFPVCLHYISFCIKAGSAERSKANFMNWCNQASHLWGGVVPMVTMTSDYSADSVVEGNDSSSPLLTHLSVSSHCSGTQNNICHKPLPLFSFLSLNVSSYRRQRQYIT